MIVEIKIPSLGESITKVELTKWLVNDSDIVERNQDIAEIDSDKATLTISTTDSGKIRIIVQSGESIAVGAVIGTIDTAFASKYTHAEQTDDISKSQEIIKPEVVNPVEKEKLIISPQAKRFLEENNIEISEIKSSNVRRVKKKDLIQALEQHKNKTDQKEYKSNESRHAEVIRLSALRRKLADRLVAVKNQTAMLTTFNEVDMTAVMALRKSYKDKYLIQYGVKLSLMSFFARAVCIAIKDFPVCNAQIEGENMLLFKYVDMGIAVSTPKGLMVPVIRNTEALSFPEFDLKLEELATKARNNKITIDEMTGGTFTITNGGVFGSMLSTPILNPPQCAILGMHNIVDRPVALEGKVVIRPVMYVALSYDHRIIDGKESVGFLIKIKEAIENPLLLFGGLSPEEALLK
jgi:2-oxoglutarate dehydrogenase E2 component (dihydrolipoamide succinyltransferase)